MTSSLPTAQQEFKYLQEKFITDFSRSTDVMASEILFSAFHPSQAMQNDHIILLEEIFMPPSQELIELSDTQTSQDRKQSNLSSLVSKDEAHSDSLDENIDLKIELMFPLQVEYEHVKLKNVEIQKGSVDQGIANKAEKKRFSSTFKHQFRQQFTYKHKEMQNISIDDLDEISTKNLLEKPKELQQRVLEVESMKSYYRISIWRLHQGKLSLMECKLEMKSCDSFYLFRDSLYFSHDGNYIFALLENLVGQIIKAIVMKSEDLDMPETNEIDLSSYDIMSDDISGDPCLIWGHKDSFNVEYARRSDRMTEIGSFTQNYFIILGMLFQENDQQSFEKSFYQRGMFIFVKFPQQQCANCIHILKTSFDRLRIKLSRSQMLTFTDEVDLVCTLKHEELRGVWNDVQIISSSNLKNILIISSLEEAQNNKGNQYIYSENNFNFAFFLSKPAEFDQLDYLEDNTQQTTHQLHQVDEEGNALTKEVIPIVFKSSTPIQTNRFPHTQNNIFVSLYNDYLQQDMIITAVDVMSELDKKENQFKHVHLDEVQSYKIDGSIEFNYLNCFDVVKDSYGKLLTLGMDFSSQLIQKLTVGVYDELSYFKFILEQQEYLFINPFLVYVNSNNQLLFTSIHKNSNRTYTFQLKEYFLGFVEFYLQSIQICDQTFYRHESCVFLTLTEGNKVVLNIIKIPVYDLYQHQDFMNPPRFHFQKIKLQYALDLRHLLKEKLLKAILGNISVKDSKKQLTIILQYEKEILIRAFNSATYQDSFSTNSLIPMIQQEGQFEISQSAMQVFVHSKQDNTQNINLLQLYQQEAPKFSSICEFKGQSIIAMARYQRMFMTLDDTQSVKIFNYSHESKQLLLFKEEEIIDEASPFIKYYQQNSFCTQKMPQCIALSNTEAYIGPTFFHFAGFSKNNSDGGYESFELERNKYIHNLTFDNLVKGPIPSLDNNFLMYICLETDQALPLDTQQSNLRESERKNMFKHQKFYSQQEVQTNDGSDKNNNELKFAQNARSRPGQNMFASLRSPRQHIQSKSVKQIADRYDPLEVINSVDSNIIEKKDNQKIKIKQKVFCIPYLGSKVVPILHKDRYLIDKIQFSTFTLQNDILVMIDGRCLMFDKNGQPIQLQIDANSLKTIQDPSVTIKRLNNHQVQAAGQSLLFEGKFTYYIYHLLPSGDINSYKLEKVYEYSKNMNQLSETIDDQAEDVTLTYKDGKQDSKGNFYQVQIEYNNESLEIQIYFNGSPCEGMQELFSFIANKDTQDFLAQCPAQLAQSFQTKDNVNEYSAIDTERKHEMNFKQLQIDFKMQFDFEIIHNRFFVLRVGKNIYYYNMLSYAKHNKVEKINLHLRRGFITQILQTQKFNLLQFVFIQICPFVVTFIITWDLEKNMEDQILEIPSKETKPLSITVQKGVSELLNYYVPTKDQGFYDLRYNFAFNFFKGSDACINDCLKHITNAQKTRNEQLAPIEAKSKLTHKQKLAFNKNELKFSRCLTLMLGVSKEQCAMLYTSYSYVDLLYIEHLSRKLTHKQTKIEESTKLEGLLLRHCKLRLQGGKNILHLFSTNHKFLKKYFEEIKYLIEDLQYKDGDRHIFYLLYPDDKGESPFDMAMKENANKCIEVMLDMLSYNPNYNYSKYIQKHMYELLTLQSQSFRNYLNTCTFEIKQFVKVKWSFPKDRLLFSHNSSYIDDKFLSENFGITMQEINTAHRIVELEEDQKTIHFSRQQSQFERSYDEVETKQGFEYDMSQEDLVKHEDFEEKEYQQVIFSAVEFENIFRGEAGCQFIKNVHANEDKTNIFKIPIMQDIILFQWNYFFGPYLRYSFFPFLLQFSFIIIYTTLAHVYQENQSDNENIIDMIVIRADWKRTHRAFGILILISFAYFLQIEIRKFLKVGRYNFFQLLFLALQLTVVILHFTNGSARAYTILSVSLVFQSYFFLFLNLRIFDNTAVLIHTAYYIVGDIKIFTFIFFIMVVGYGNAFYIASGLQTDGNFPFPGDDLGLAFFYSYSMVLGNFDQTAYTGLGADQWIALLCLLSCTFFGSVVLLNMIIALMNDTYSSVMQIQKEERLIAKCALIYEYDFLFLRDSYFKNTKYIIIAQLDSIKDGTYDAEGRVTSMKQYLDQRLTEDYEKNNNNFKQVKLSQRILQNQIKTQESKLCDVQGKFSSYLFYSLMLDALIKIMDQLKKIETQKKVKSIVKKSQNIFKSVFKQKLEQNKDFKSKITNLTSEERKSKGGGGFNKLSNKNIRAKHNLFSTLIKKTSESN